MLNKRQRRCSGRAGRLSRSATETKKKTLQEGIANFYDASTGVWVEIWGEHLHHGYYPEGFKGSLAEHRKAQVTMVEKVLGWAGVPEPGSPGAPQVMLDVGCGVGGSSRHLQRKYGGKATGITLSPKQRAQAEALSEAAGQADSTSFQVADALNMPFADNSFDLVWSLESGEHMPNKPKFMSELNRVCKPGGRIILVTWVHRNLPPGEESLQPKELRLLKRISKAYHLPDWCSMDDYVQIGKDQLGIQGIRTDDWTTNIMPFWGAVIRSALQPRGWWALIRGGWQTFKGALVMPLMARGYTTGTIKFALMTGTKGSASGGASSGGNAEAAGGSPAAPTSAAALPVVAKGPRRVQAGRRRGFIGRAAHALRSHRVRRRAAVAAEAGTQKDGLWKTIVTIWDFTRPHTLVGTLISIPAVHLFAAAPFIASKGFASIAPSMLHSIILALVPALLINLYITGLNQIFDVDIDKVNKPYLPIPAGRLSLAGAWRACLVALSLAVAWAWINFGARSWPLHLTLAGSAFLGTAYSAPPIRLKRSPFLAAFCIIVVRGLLVNLGFYCFAMEGLGAVGLEAIDARGITAAAFFAVFGLVIALMKDVPDIIGDEMKGIRSLSVRLGPERVLQAASVILWGLLLATAGFFGVGAASAASTGQMLLAMPRAALSLAAIWSLRYAVTSRRGVDAKDPAGVFSFYMDVWKVFYASYLCLPLAR